MEAGSTVRNMVKEHIAIVIPQNIKVIGKMTNKMVGGYSFSQTMIVSKETLKMVKGLVEEFTITVLEINTMVNTGVIKEMVKDNYIS
jgi:hypothetical protein